MKLLMTCGLLYIVFIARHLASTSLLLRYNEGRISACPACLAVALWPGPRRQSNDILPTTFGDNGPEPSWDNLWRPGGIADTTLALLGRF